MNSHEHIEDDLPLYAMGNLGQSDRQRVEDHLAECSECRRELLQLRGDLALVGLSAMGPAPQVRARQRLLTAISQEPRATTQPKAARWWTLVPSALAFALLIASFVLWQQNDAMRQNLAVLHTQIDRNRADAERARQILSVMTAPDAVRVTLVAANTRPQPQGKVIYSARSGSLVFLANNFASVPPGKAYELWLLPSNGGSPIPAGTFNPDAGGNASVLMPPLPKDTVAKAFAITVEPESGSTTPTMPILLSGGA
jgi:anti-sigma-K factor RskA